MGHGNYTVCLLQCALWSRHIRPRHCEVPQLLIPFASQHTHLILFLVHIQPQDTIDVHFLAILLISMCRC
jgi:hypothetical protein